MYTTFIYDGSFNGLITAVYDAFYEKLKTDEVRITDNSMSDDMATLFDRQIFVESSEIKAGKVITSLINKISEEVYHQIFKIYLSFYPQKGDLIFQYIKLCFSMGPRVLDHISHPLVAEINRITNRVSRETSKLLGFVRFQELKGGALFSQITPENNQLELIAPHFVERLYDENWIIYDANRKLACIHLVGKDFIITDDIPEDILNGSMDKMNTEEEAVYQSLWKAFFDTIGIEARFNPKCQRTMMPKRYWKNMPEVKDKLKK